MQSVGVLEFPASRPGVVHSSQAGGIFADGLPCLPVLPETILALELLAQNRSVDLREASRIVLSDMGATLQIFRLAAVESGSVDARCQRIEDCISFLGLPACIAALEPAFHLGLLQQKSILAVWHHAREIAEFAQTLAETGVSPIIPEEAYLTGLLHPLGVLPSLFSWDEPDLALDEALVGLQLSARWALPASVRNLFCAAFIPGHQPHRLELVREAYRRAGSTSPWCTVASGFSA